MREKASEIFKVLSVDTRLKILDLLKNKGPLGAKSIAEEFDISVSAISQHLKIMKQVDIIESKRDGYHIPYSVNEEVLEKCHQILDHVCSCNQMNFLESHGSFFEHHLKPLPLNKLKEIEKHLETKLHVVRKLIEKYEKE